jgi:catechol O-methyltransferase
MSYITPQFAAYTRASAQALHRDIMTSPNKSSLQGKPQAVLDAITAWTEKNGFMIIFQPAKLAVSKKALQGMGTPPKTLVELGTYVGTSAVAWGQMLVELNGGRKEGVKVWTCELDSEYAGIARDFVALAGLEGVVEVVEGKSGDSLAKFAKEGKIGKGELDVLFLDHWEDAYLPDLKLCEELRLFHEGSLIVADNTDVPGTPEYLEYVQKGGDGKVRYETESVDSGEVAESWMPRIVEVTKVLKVE